jgi:hypothetical protein
MISASRNSLPAGNLAGNLQKSRPICPFRAAGALDHTAISTACREHPGKHRGFLPQTREFLPRKKEFARKDIGCSLRRSSMFRNYSICLFLNIVKWSAKSWSAKSDPWPSRRGVLIPYTERSDVSTDAAGRGGHDRSMSAPGKTGHSGGSMALTLLIQAVISRGSQRGGWPRSNYTPSRPLSDGLAVPLKHRLRRLSGFVEALTGREHARSVLHGPFA